MAGYTVIERPEWRTWATPAPLKDRPIHRWYYFPHSFTADLVEALIGEWGLDGSHHILDPFCGAGTTIVSAKKKGVPATGYDISPFAAHVASAKVANYSAARLNRTWAALRLSLDPRQWNGASRTYPPVVRRSLPGDLLGAFDAVWRSVASLPCSHTEKRFFRLAVLRTIRSYSRLAPAGGWLSWSGNRRNKRSIPRTLSANVLAMIRDVADHSAPRRRGFRALVGDARNLPDADATYSAVITSPPYPNRHDYTRVFSVELMFAFLGSLETRSLRYQSFESHPEAHPKRPDSTGYAAPPSLSRVLRRLESRGLEPRIARMLSGYFLDSYLCLREAARVCRVGAHLAFVVGNAQYAGEPIAVDELTAEIGEQVGLRCKRLIAVRERGNSAQQMAAFGRRPSRESVVEFVK